MKNLDRPTLIVAFILAIFLWTYVRISQETPHVRRVIGRVPVVLVGKASGVKVSVHPNDRSVNVAIRGRSEAVNSVLPDEVAVQVDISDLTQEGRVRRPVSVQLPRLVQLDGRPPVVTLIADVLEQKSMPVTVSFVSSPPPGSTVGDYLIQPANATVEGTRDALAQVAYVVVPVDPHEQIGSLEVPPRAVNVRGDRVDGVNVLQASVVVRKASGGTTSAREVAVRPPALLRVPRQYTIRVAKVRPDEVTLTGEAALLEKQPAYLETYPIDVHLVTRDATRTVRLRIPPGLTVVEGPDVRVDLQVQPIQP